jgi:hypothetical protein
VFRGIKQGLHKPSPKMQPETYCEQCFFPSALCSCYSPPLQLPSTESLYWSCWPTYHPVFPEGDTFTFPNTVIQEGGIFTFPNAAGMQTWMAPTDSILPNIGPVEPPPEPVLGMQLLYNALSIPALPYFYKPATY